MWEKKLCLNLSSVCGIPYEEQLPLFKNTGFDGFFVTWNPNLDVLALANKARELAMMFQSIHAPWDKAADFWHGDEIKAQKAIDELKACIDSCALCGVPILVVHAFIGFEEHNPTETGLVRFGKVVDYAREKGIRIAFENTEGEEYLAALMEHRSRGQHAQRHGNRYSSGSFPYCSGQSASHRQIPFETAHPAQSCLPSHRQGKDLRNNIQNFCRTEGFCEC